ncbi:leucine dehydrogenase [Marinobacterium zhoushanense]|uniref:Leucine dehydrogenase n=1 Tax=Marinobacterium zhoushanense TaxID=1679163 RepID=A0ABQ1K8G4_9GAMM|nr:Glu/Leu/Phe/Val dehydrogenase [Marinobacterium zhoushanense]GGB88898.1 leucine dehydrogenase [Marinobacterium zhoushanense]
MFRQLEDAGLTDIHIGLDAATGMRAIVAIHSTARGPAIGGCRFLQYANEQEAMTDVIRLARGMSYKAALADLPHGGGKAVLLRPDRPFDRKALMQAFGRFVDTLGGRYITAVDSGSEVSDMDIIAQETRWVSCTSRSGDPSPYTAIGVLSGIQAFVKVGLGRQSLSGLRVALQGLGHVGMDLAQKLHAAGAQLVVSDLEQPHLDTAVRDFNAEVVEPDAIYAVDCDLFCPCGLGAILNENTIPRLRCKIVAGSANNQLAREEDGERLRERGILYAPDYIINSGGLIQVAMQHAGAPDGAIIDKIVGMGATLERLLEDALRLNLPIEKLADRLAEQRLHARHASQHHAA